MIVAFSILMFMAVGLFFWGLVLDRRAAQGQALANRLGHVRREGPSVLAERDLRFSALPWLDRLLRGGRFGRHLELLLYQGGLSIRAGALVLLIEVAAIGGYLLGLVLFHRLMPALLFMVVLGPLPYWYMLYRKSVRMKAFAKQFPDALDLMVTGLKAGLSFSAALQIVSEESPEPLRSEFAVVVEEQALGLDFRDSMMHLTERVDVLDLRFFATAVLLQRETGGNLAEVLANTATLIRERFRVLGDITTFTAQGRLTGLILVCLPVGIGLFTAVMAPEYFRPMIESDAGRIALWWAAGMQLVGIIAIAKIVNIKV